MPIAPARSRMGWDMRMPPSPRPASSRSRSAAAPAIRAPGRAWTSPTGCASVPARLAIRDWCAGARPGSLHGMELLVVGSGAAYPDRPGTASSCYVVLHEGAAICLDLGQGAFAGLAGRLEPADLAGVVVSHLHPDHFVDLVALRHYLRYEFDPPRGMRVIAPAGLQGRLDGVMGEPGFATRVTLATAADGPAIVYSGDCGRAADLAPLIRPGDVLLCEVAFGPGPIPVPDLHLDGAAVGRLAAETRVSQVLLTHLQMHRDPVATLAAARAEYGGQVSLVSDGDRIPITG